MMSRSHGMSDGMSDGMTQAASGQRASLADYLAAERTLLAWIRTGLALMGFGFVVARFGLFLQQIAFVQRAPVGPSYGLSLWFGTALIAVGVLVNLFAGWHHLRLVRDLDRGVLSHSRPSRQAVAVAFFLGLVGIAMAIYLSIRNATPAPAGNPVTRLMVRPCSDRGGNCAEVGVHSTLRCRSVAG
jgi:putative membrane protein